MIQCDAEFSSSKKKKKIFNMVPENIFISLLNRELFTIGESCFVLYSSLETI